MDAVNYNVTKELNVWIFQLLALVLCVEPVHWDSLEMDSNAMVYHASLRITTAMMLQCYILSTDAI